MTSTETIGTRLHRHLFETERRYPQATGELSALLSQLALAGKRIAASSPAPASRRSSAPSGKTNVQGETQQKLDALANDIFLEAFAYGQLVPTVVTEEMDLPRASPENEAVAASAGKYVVFVDPLDGSSNLDINGAVGSVFSVRRIGGSGPIHSEAELLARISQQQVVAGYFVYGPATMLVYTAGPKAGVQGFTLDPGIGEFLLSHPDIRIPAQRTYYAGNEGFIGTSGRPGRGVRRSGSGRPTPGAAALAPRYSGALVVDVHRILLRGGVFLPGDRQIAGGQAEAAGTRPRRSPWCSRRRAEWRRAARRGSSTSDPAQPPADPALHRRPRIRRGSVPRASCAPRRRDRLPVIPHGLRRPRPGRPGR
ncbi:MAG: fructose-1,6-bisphosphatase [Holophagales bacterium]|nr:fructose-1,6-bisphosphatase [Holophagales bacterium]